eukprot:scaffold112932_cov27-Prasinocladus_malaysianus.AAC.2
MSMLTVSVTKTTFLQYRLEGLYTVYTSNNNSLKDKLIVHALLRTASQSSSSTARTSGQYDAKCPSRQREP